MGIRYIYIYISSFIAATAQRTSGLEVLEHIPESKEAHVGADVRCRPRQAGYTVSWCELQMVSLEDTMMGEPTRLKPCCKKS